LFDENELKKITYPK